MSEPSGDVDPRLRALAATLPVIGPHPDEDTWVALQSGMLSQPARRAVGDHIASCPSCAETLRAIVVLTDEARQAGLNPPVVHATWLGASRTILLMAATLVAAVGVVAWVGSRSSGRSGQPASIARESAAAGPGTAAPLQPGGAAEAPSPSANEAPRPWALALSAPAVQLPARYALPTRGTADDRAFLEAFGDAIAPYRDGDFSKAAAMLDGLTTRFPDVPEAAFYLGVARLFSGDAAGARAPLARAARSDSVGDAARWFGAAAAEQTGMRDEADSGLRALCQGSSEYRAAACNALGTAPPRD